MQRYKLQANIAKGFKYVNKKIVVFSFSNLAILMLSYKNGSSCRTNRSKN